MSKLISIAEIPEGFEVSRPGPWEKLTDEANTNNTYIVKRVLPPFSDETGNIRQWSGKTLYEALVKAYNDLNLENPIIECVPVSREQYDIQMSAICCAALGYWEEDHPIHEDYDTPALREVAKLYKKYYDLVKSKGENNG